MCLYIYITPVIFSVFRKNIDILQNEQNKNSVGNNKFNEYMYNSF